jgi:hypothetical protein
VTPKPPKDIDTGERDAIVDEIRDEVTAEMQTPAPTPGGVSTETMRRLARNEARPIVRNAISDHADQCEHEGPLCAVAAKVEDVEKKIDLVITTLAERRGADRVWALVRAAGGAVALAVLGFTLNHFAARRSENSVRQTIEAAADVARQLKAVQDATRAGHGSLWSPGPPSFALRRP